MTGQLTLILIIVVLVAIAVAAWFYVQKLRSKELREHFGPEYDRAVQEYGERGTAESALREREKRVEALDLHSLSSDERARFADTWRSIQAQFVDDPAAAAAAADRLIHQVMQARGYPVGDFEQRAADISVEHPQVVSNYRAAHAIALRAERGEATTEDFRNALVYYRSLLEELIETGETKHAEARR